MATQVRVNGSQGAFGILDGAPSYSVNSAPSIGTAPIVGASIRFYKIIVAASGSAFANGLPATSQTPAPIDLHGVSVGTIASATSGTITTTTFTPSQVGILNNVVVSYIQNGTTVYASGYSATNTGIVYTSASNIIEKILRVLPQGILSYYVPNDATGTIYLAVDGSAAPAASTGDYAHPGLQEIIRNLSISNGVQTNIATDYTYTNTTGWYSGFVTTTGLASNGTYTANAGYDVSGTTVTYGTYFTVA
jgi:hypothetical protein